MSCKILKHNFCRKPNRINRKWKKRYLILGSFRLVIIMPAVKTKKEPNKMQLIMKNSFMQSRGKGRWPMYERDLKM